MRYFRASPEIYLAVCSTLDTEYGYPNPHTKTFRTLPIANELPHDLSGLVYLAVNNDYCEYILPSQILASLISSGSVEEISASDYMSVSATP